MPLSPAAALRAMRPVKSYTCAHCGRGFTATDTRAKYCSNRCRQAVKYAKRKAGKSDKSKRPTQCLPSADRPIHPDSPTR